MRRPRTAALFLVLCASPLRADDPFFFQKNDRVLFLGDSITEQYQYSTDIELYLTTRFPDWNLTFLNAGISGDTATGGASRFRGHVLAEKPTCVTIDFGMNDAGYGAFDAGRNKQYVDNTVSMLDMAKQAGVRVALISPNAVDRRVRPDFKRYLETQKEFYAPLRPLAERYGVSFVDQYAVTREELEHMEREDPKADRVRPFGDGFHTGPSGGLLMAHAILTGLKAPAKVSDAAITVGKAEAKTERCKVENVQSSADGVSFDRTDEAVPMPILPEWQSVLPYINHLRDLNDYGLKVSGLPEGRYSVMIDGKGLHLYTDKELAEGVNLGNFMEGPLFEQGVRVFRAINAKNDLVHSRFRDVVMFNLPGWAQKINNSFVNLKDEELERRLAAINARQAEVYRLVKPVKHTFKVVKVKAE